MTTCILTMLSSEIEDNFRKQDSQLRYLIKLNVKEHIKLRKAFMPQVVCAVDSIWELNFFTGKKRNINFKRNSSIFHLTIEIKCEQYRDKKSTELYQIHM